MCQAPLSRETLRVGSNREQTSHGLPGRHSAKLGGAGQMAALRADRFQCGTYPRPIFLRAREVEKARAADG